MTFHKFSKDYESVLMLKREESLEILQQIYLKKEVSDIDIIVNLKKELPYISYFYNDSDIALLNNLGLTNLTFKNFIHYQNICKDLSLIFEKYNYNINFILVFKCYEFYLSDFFMSILNLESKFDFDFKNITDRIRRQLKNGTFEKGLTVEKKMN